MIFPFLLSDGGGTVFVAGQEILSDIGSFSIYKAGKDETILAGPAIPEQNWGILKGKFIFEGVDKGENFSYDYQLQQLSPNILRVTFNNKSSMVSWPRGIGFRIGKLMSFPFADSVMESDGETFRLTTSSRPRDNRFLIRERSTLLIRSSFVDIKVVPLEGDISVRVRSASWGNKWSHNLFSGRSLIPGRKASFGYDLVFSQPSLTVSEQHGRSSVPTVLPFKIKDSTSFLTQRVKHDPDLAIRGVLTELLPPGNKDINYLKRYVQAIAKAHGNTLVLHHKPEHVQWLQGDNTPDNWWSRDDLVEINDYARSLGIDVIPGMLSKFNPRDFPLLSRGEHRGFYNTF